MSSFSMEAGLAAAFVAILHFVLQRPMCSPVIALSFSRSRMDTQSAVNGVGRCCQGPL